MAIRVDLLQIEDKAKTCTIMIEHLDINCYTAYAIVWFNGSNLPLPIGEITENSREKAINKIYEIALKKFDTFFNIFTINKNESFEKELIRLSNKTIEIRDFFLSPIMQKTLLSQKKLVI